MITIEPNDDYFEYDKLYKRRELHDKYGGNRQGGISYPRNSPFIMIFSGERGKEFGYEDYWVENTDTFIYTGEGQEGDMRFDRGNREIRDHEKNKKRIFLLENMPKMKTYVKYFGELKLKGYFFKEGLDKHKKIRKMIIFEMESIINQSDDNEDIPTNDESIYSAEYTLSELKEKAIGDSALSRPAIERIANYRKRSIWIRKYALKRANNICEGCNAPAPFQTITGEYYLEVHHVYRLSQEGADHPDFVVAICPNCHRRTHHSSNQEEFNNSLIQITKSRNLFG